MRRGGRPVRAAAACAIAALASWGGADAMAEGNIRLSCQPRAFQAVVGEPMRLELAIEADSAAPIRLHIPAHPSLVLRAIEKPPVQRTKEGAILHRRVVIWQALKPGTVKVNAISVETAGRKSLFPEITIRVGEIGP